MWAIKKAIAIKYFVSSTNAVTFFSVFVLSISVSVCMFTIFVRVLQRKK